MFIVLQYLCLKITPANDWIGFTRWLHFTANDVITNYYPQVNDTKFHKYSHHIVYWKEKGGSHAINHGSPNQLDYVKVQYS